MILSMQISYAKSWIDCGLKVDSLIGHSFGQISALCVAHSISLRDAFRLIAGRARLIRDKWGPDRGVMLSIECDRADAESLVNRAKVQDGYRVNIACYNGPRSFVLAGDSRSMEWLEIECHAFKTTRLHNTHAYHSYMADGILDDFKKLTQTITVRPPDIHIETCSPDASWTSFSASAIAEHTRQPVYFSEAVQRVANRLPSALWLEAGSDTPVVSMTRRTLAHPGKAYTFVSMGLGKDNAIENLASACCELWTAGVDFRIPFWPFHERSSAKLVDLPPYQFEGTRHWIQYKPNTNDDTTDPMQPYRTSSSGLVTMLKNVGKDGEYKFTVNTSNAVFDLATSGHAVAGQSLCPASMYIELATQSALLLSNSQCDAHGSPHIEDLVMSAPLGLGASLFINLMKDGPSSWRFSIFSETLSERTEHGRGRISLLEIGDVIVETRLKLLQKIAPSLSMDRIVNSSTANSIGGTIVYQLFSEIVNYATYYRGVKSVFALGNEAAGFVDLPVHSHLFDTNSTSCKPIELDNFLQVAGIHVNCLSPRQDGEVFMCTTVDEVILDPSFLAATTNPQSWKVYTRHESGVHGTLTNNVFVFDSTNKLVAAIMGAIFRSVSLKALTRTLSRINQLDIAVPVKYKEGLKPLADSGYQSDMSTPFPDPIIGSMQSVSLTAVNTPPTPEHTVPDVLQRLRSLLSDIIEVPVDEILPSSRFEDLGIDSLLVTEVIWEIQQRLRIRVTQEDFLGCDDVLSLYNLLEPPENSEITLPLTPTETINVSTVAPERDLVVSKGSYSFDLVTQECFSDIKRSYDAHADRTGFSGFYAGPFLIQSQLVVQYVLDAFAALGCVLKELPAGETVPIIPHVEAHQKLIPQLYKVLEDARLIAKTEEGVYQRTTTILPSISASSLHDALLTRFPQHSSELKLLHTTGHQLAECLSGTADPISLIFRDSTTRALLEDVYTNAPMFKAGTLLLAQYLSNIITRLGSNRKLHILELGAGTGGTTKEIVSTLAQLSSDSNFTYTFTDLSSSLVASARRKFSQWQFMRFAVLDIEKAPSPELLADYDIIISTNCIHATKDLTRSATHIREMLKPDGILCLVELTRNLFWFDLVFGLLSGWWLFNDGRSHVLADERRWEVSLRKAGFSWIDWSEGSSRESDLLRLITASQSNSLITPIQKETLVFKKVDGLELEADLYYPAKILQSTKPLPVGENKNVTM
jgi:malonyl CoA-acyl carrier protein transacylase